MAGWLDIQAISDILNLKNDSILKSICRGKFTKTRQQKVTGKGARGGKIWQIHITDPAIPQDKRETWLKSHSETTNLPAVAPAKQIQELAELKSWQTRTMDARLAIIRYLEESARAVGISEAVATAVKQAHSGDLPDHLQPLVRIANKRSGDDAGKRTLSTTTLYRWRREYKAAGDNYAALAPKATEKDAIPPWAPAFLKAYRVPQKISVAAAIEDMKAGLPAGSLVPTESQAYRFIEKMSRLDIQRGRKSPQELRGQKGYCDRDTSKFEPGDICLCDGHSFKAYIAHPAHGRPFHPEVCAVIDAVTRTVIGWSAGLAESAQTVADAVRHAVTVSEAKPEGCIPAIFYTDPGAGNKANVNANDFTGLYARLGTTWKTGIPGNSQARGMVERMQGTLWVKAAKHLSTFTGKDMDKVVRRKVYLLLDAEVKKATREGQPVKSDILMSWKEFLDFCQQVVDTYNRRPHSSLPRISDPATGLRRHMCPLEYWSQFLAEGWRPTLPTPSELETLFRPQMQVKAIRGGVTVFGNRYTNKDLEHYQGEIVHVGYDIHDAGKVWVRDMDERMICIAKFEGNKRDFYPVPFVEQAVEQRRLRRHKTAMNRVDEIEMEAEGIRRQLAPVKVHITPEQIEASERVLQLVQKRSERKIVGSVWERYEDICDRAKTGDISEYERQWKVDYEAFSSTGKKSGLYRDDEYCTGDFEGQELTAEG